MRNVRKNKTYYQHAFDQVKEIWEVIRIDSNFILDYSRQQNLYRESGGGMKCTIKKSFVVPKFYVPLEDFREEMSAKWGMSTLPDPKRIGAPIELLNRCLGRMKIDGVIVKNYPDNDLLLLESKMISTLVRKHIEETLPNPPSTLLVEIDPTLPIDEIKRQITLRIKAYRDACNVTERRPTRIYFKDHYLLRIKYEQRLRGLKEEAFKKAKSDDQKAGLDSSMKTLRSEARLIKAKDIEALRKKYEDARQTVGF